MHFFATSAQIANEFGFDHEIVIKTIQELTYPTIIADQIQLFDLGPTKIAQVTEPGYNAVVLNLPLNTGGDDDLLLKWKEAFLFNKAPSVAALTAPSAPKIPSNPVAASTSPSVKNPIPEHIRRKADELISSGSLDNIITETYANIHRELVKLMEADPGYQNVRAYAVARRNALGLNVKG